MSGPEIKTHLDDEAFCALADGALEGADQEKALAHLAACPDCLAQWAGLLRNLEATEEAGQEVPRELKEKALRLAEASRDTPPPA